MISKRLFGFAMPIIAILAALLVARAILASRPEAETRSEPAQVMVVDATRLKTAQFPVVIRSQGTVEPTLSNALVPEVGGSVVTLAPTFVVGGRFAAGDVLVELDRRDYEIALTQAEANLAQAVARLQEQAALAERAADEWRILGRSGTPSALTLRKPQLAAAEADRDAAQAQLSRARLDVERTRLVAPFAGIVGEKSVEVGQFVARGASLGRIHAINSAEVTLPVSAQLIDLLDLQGDAPVQIFADMGADEQVWQATLVRVEGIDSASQQLTVVAQVARPYDESQTGSGHPLRFGQFVQASITGRVLDDVFVIPRSALREQREVLLIDNQNTIQRRAVEVRWSDDTNAVISSGLTDGEILVVTPLSTVTDGTPVIAVIDGVEPD